MASKRKRKPERLLVDVLIVEDQPELRSSLAELLDDADFAVAWAENGAAALQLVDGGVRPRLVLLDLNMPVMDGWQFLRARAAHPVLAKVPVILASGEAPSAEVRAQVAACLEKPLDVRSLIRLTERAVAAAG